jgi:phosphatidylserine decarboxylase
MTLSQPEAEGKRTPLNRTSLSGRLPIEPMDPQITSIQPGGGLGMQLELAWGRWRRAYLKAVRKGYVERMRTSRLGEPQGCPHEVLDPRDLKYYRNVTNCNWSPETDPFAWRGRLPFARPGLAELILLGGGCFVLAVIFSFVFWPAAIVAAVLGLFVVSFFRNPRRVIPTDAGLVVSPADGKVVLIERIAHDDFVGGPAILIGIFLSVFNVHVNRSPVEARVIGISYRKGKYLNALKAASARENEQLAVRLEENSLPHRRMIVRQIAGAIARRIVCEVKPGDDVARGQLFGMIKFGSRTELVMPDEPGLKIRVELGAKVRGGASILAQYEQG